MLQEIQEPEEELLDRQELKETEEKENLPELIEKRKEMFKNVRKRRDICRSISESNYDKFRHQSSSKNWDNSSPYCRGHLYPNKCAEHRNSEIIYFPEVGRQIRRGCCLGHSQKGYIAYSGVDVGTGQLLYITEWNIKYSHIEQKYNANNSHDQRSSVDDFINDIEKQISNLSQIRHKNLINYECVMCMKKKEGLYVYIVQDFVLGTSINIITTTLGWCAEGASMVAKGVLEALIYLHNNGVSHGHLYDSTVFMDNTGNVRCTDFSIIQKLLEVNGGHKTDRDLPALGALIESLMPTQHTEMEDFIEKCKSERTLSASDLLEHPFLRPSLFSEAKTKSTFAVNQTENKKLVPLYPQPSLTSTHSRLHTEFEVLQWLGKGAYGVVLKVRNNLDNREYAIKRIPLPARSRQLYQRMTREVELLSRLNHENVVRYFNSWIEMVNPSELDDDKLGASDCSVSQDSYQKQSNQAFKALPSTCDSDSDGIEFIDSNGEVPVYEESGNESSNEDSSEESGVASPRQAIQVMYIQMEFCEKFTLRTIIDENLYENAERVWRLFREIAEGLAHIHQQGIIHRDLKPVNIFLDSRDQIKIGDFGLATTSFLALQSIEQHLPGSSESVAGTGIVGTTLYVAPELTGNASKSIYNQKVDMYTLGIILFEMIQPPFETAMERVDKILDLRNEKIIIPKKMLGKRSHVQTVKLLRWLLTHDQLKRPSAEELLASNLVPVTQLESNSMEETFRHCLANPQSKMYKNLVAKCLQQESDTVMELTYNLELVNKSLVSELVKDKVIRLFRKHGAIEITTPLLTPFSCNTFMTENPVKLMTHSGSVVELPNDLHAPFARYIAMTGANMVRRYSVNRVYCEKKVFNLHPKQNYECAFDIITPNPGNFLVDAELLSVAFEMVNDLPLLKQKNICVRINHTSLLRAILLFCNVPHNKYEDLFESILDYIDRKKTKSHLKSSIVAIMEASEPNQRITFLTELLLMDIEIGRGTDVNVGLSVLRTLTRGKCEASVLANTALRELETLISQAQNFGVTCPIRLLPGLPIGYRRASSGGIVWQMIANIKSIRNARPWVFAVGGRYDTMLLEYQKQAEMCNVSIPHRPISGVGMSFSLEKLVAAAAKRTDRNIEVVVCASGVKPANKDVTDILKMLWNASVPSAVVEGSSDDEAQDYAKHLGARHFILVDEGGVCRVRSLNYDRFSEVHVNRTEMLEYVKRMTRRTNPQRIAMDTMTIPLISTLPRINLNHTRGLCSRLP